MREEAIHFQGEEVARAVKEWWAELTQERAGKPADRAGRAQLRRCRSMFEAVACPAFHRLYHRLRRLGHRLDGRRLAPAAAVLAHVEMDTAPQGISSLATLMARPRPGSGQPRVSGLRFRRLLLVEDREELLPALSRVVRLLGGQAPVAPLAGDIYWWGERVKERWAYDYYAAAPRTD